MGTALSDIAHDSGQCRLSRCHAGDAREATTSTLGVEGRTLRNPHREEIATVFDANRSRAGALYVVGHTFMNSNRVRIATLAVAARLPTMYVHRGGGLSCAC
jgi:hypothetical protein